jgi:DNA-binding transcriptional LysR family regulator
MPFRACHPYTFGMALELRQLRQVLALAQHGSFGRAATALHMTQPALSRSLKLIESEIGSVLFDRSPTGVTPTDQGRLLVRRARELVDAADELEREVARQRVGGTDQLHIGVGPYAGETVVPAALARFISGDDLVRVRVLQANWDDFPRRLRARELDFFVAEFSTLVGEHDLEVRPMEQHQGYFVGRKGHPLARRTPVRLDETFAFPFVALSRYPPRALQPMLAARTPSGARQPGRPFPAIECASLAVVKQILCGSDGIAGLTLPMIAEDIERGSLAVLGSAPWLFVHYAVVTLKGAPRSAACGRLIRCLEEAEAELAREEARLIQAHLPRTRGDGARSSAG